MSSLTDRFGAVSDALSSGDFDAVGSNSTTFNYGTGSGDLLGTLPALPAIASGFAPSATTPGNVVTSSGGATSGGFIPGAGGAVAMPSNAQAGAGSASASTSSGAGSVKDYFLRAVIIILGFIFVAMGLNMFRPGLVPNPVKAIR